jgi:hypothetical protein
VYTALYYTYVVIYPQGSEAASDSQGSVIDDDADAADSDSDASDDDSPTNGDTTDTTKESRRAAKKRHEQELQSLLADEGHSVNNNANDGANEDAELSNESAVVLDRLTGQPFASDILMHAVRFHQCSRYIHQELTVIRS